MSAQPEFPQRSILAASPISLPAAAGPRSAPDATRDRTASILAPSRRVADSLLALHADLLDDYESMRIAHENRIRSLTDGEHGKGVNADLPELQPFLAELDELKAREHGAALMLKRALRKHYLADWVKRTVGVGEKQAARLLAAIGDPAERNRPSQLWAYCGLHVLHPGHTACASHATNAGVEPSSSSHCGHDGQATTAAGSHPTDQGAPDTQCPNVGGVAPKRRRGQRARWSTTAKTRAYLVAESCIKQRSSPYRPVYDEGRAKYADAVHNQPCERCGPSGSPAQPGSPLSDGHKHARAMRLVMKRILLDLWREARDV